MLGCSLIYAQRPKPPFQNLTLEGSLGKGENATRFVGVEGAYQCGGCLEVVISQSEYLSCGGVKVIFTHVFCVSRLCLAQRGMSISMCWMLTDKGSHVLGFVTVMPFMF